MEENKLQTVQPSLPSVPGQEKFVQTGNDNVLIPNYGTVNINVQAQPMMPPINGTFYVPLRVNREYYNLFVIGIEEFDKPYFKVPRDRALNQCMSDEAKKRFEALTPEIVEEIKTMPSLFLAENEAYGKANDDQRVIYGFVSDVKIYDNDVKIYFCGYKIDIVQQRLNELRLLSEMRPLLTEKPLLGTGIKRKKNWSPCWQPSKRPAGITPRPSVRRLTRPRMEKRRKHSSLMKYCPDIMRRFIIPLRISVRSMTSLMIRMPETTVSLRLRQI